MIKGISDRRRLPRAGKIRLGIKKAGNKPCRYCKGAGKMNGATCPDCAGSGKSQYPSEVDFFVCPPEVAKVAGEKPRQLDVMIPVEDSEIFFPQALKCYGRSAGLKCRGDGETAMRANEKGEFEEIECAYRDCQLYQKKECTEVGNLMVLLPAVSLSAGIWQIDTGSYHSIVQINSDVDYIRALVNSRTGQPRISMIPLVLSREPKETHGSGRKEQHFCLRLRITDEVLGKLKMMVLPEPKRYRLVKGDPKDIEEDLYPRRLVEGVKVEEEPAEESPQAPPPSPPPPAKPETPAPPAPSDEAAAPEPETGMEDIWQRGNELMEIAGVSMENREKFCSQYKEHPGLLAEGLSRWIDWRDNGRQGPEPKMPRPPAPVNSPSPALAPTPRVKRTPAVDGGNGSLF